VKPRKILRVDDVRTIAETPAVMLLPVGLNYSGTPLLTFDDFAVYATRWDDARMRLPLFAPISLDLRIQVPVAIRTIELNRQEFGRSERHLRYWRRLEARAGGRRQARSIPIEERWRVYVFAENGADERTMKRVADTFATVVERTWRHGSAVDWARRAAKSKGVRLT
jgi:hypothetical protein